MSDDDEMSFVIEVAIVVFFFCVCILMLTGTLWVGVTMGRVLFGGV